MYQEEENYDADDPSDIDESVSDSEGDEAEICDWGPEYDQIPLKIELTHVSEGDKKNVLYDNESPETVSQIKANSFEGEPPLKKVKFSSENNNKSNQIDSLNSHEEKQTEEETDIECDYDNINANFFAEELTSDDEILTFQCPENFDVKSLLNKSIDLSRNIKLKDDFNKYECETVKLNNNKQIHCVFPSKEKGAVLLKLPVSRHIVLRQVFKVHKKNIDSHVDCESENVQLPDTDHKKRHPLLGTEWDDHISMVRRQMRKHKKLLRRSLKHEKNLEKSEKERKEQKKKLKVELALLKKKHILDK